MDLEEEKLNKRIFSIKPINFIIAVCIIGAVGTAALDKIMFKDNDEKNQLYTTELNNGKLETLKANEMDKGEVSEREDNSPVNYSSLRFAETTPIPTTEESGKKYGFIDVVGFDESRTKDSDLVIKGTVTNAYYKTYKYDEYYGQEPNRDILHNVTTNVVYEVKIEDILYSDGNFQAGDIIKIEEPISLSWSVPAEEEFCKLKINHQYIIPVKDVGENIVYSFAKENYAGGDIKRDTRYSISYSYAPQIEVTLDNEYIFNSGLTSLMNTKTRDVILADSELSHLKLKIRDDEDFIADLKRLYTRET